MRPYSILSRNVIIASYVRILLIRRFTDIHYVTVVIFINFIVQISIVTGILPRIKNEFISPKMSAGKHCPPAIMDYGRRANHFSHKRTINSLFRLTLLIKLVSGGKPRINVSDNAGYSRGILGGNGLRNGINTEII